MMGNKPGMKSGERKLLAAFACLIFLTVCIGAVALMEIRSLSRGMNRLASHNMALEKAVLEMKINYTVYAAGVRNYVFWKVSRYLGAVSLAVDRNGLLSAGEGFRRNLELYRKNAVGRRQAGWAGEIESSFGELEALGSHIIDVVDDKDPASSNRAVNDLLMVFESRLYKLDNFLDKTVRLDNLADIERELSRTEAARDRAVILLLVSLLGAVMTGSLIALSVIRRRVLERVYRQKLFNRMIHLEENERKSLSAEIHDQMGQELSALKIALGLISQKMGAQPSEVMEWFARAKETTATLMRKRHNIAYILRPPALDEIGLVDSIEELLIEYGRLTGVRYTYDKPEGALALPPEHDLLLYRLAQELLNNMAKYARAKNVRIGFKVSQGVLEFDYEDDGIGFSSSEVFASPRRRKADDTCLGLLGLKERVELLEGTIRIDTAPAKGMRVVVRIGV